MGGTPNGVMHLLLVDDNPGDIRLMREALRTGTIDHRVSVAGDGEAALDFLWRRGKYGGAPRPDLVLLDLNLPRMDGRAVLRAIQGDAALRRIPVVVFTTSSDREDIAASYGMHANAVVTKPIGLDDFITAILAIENFWFGAAALSREN